MLEVGFVTKLDFFFMSLTQMTKLCVSCLAEPEMCAAKEYLQLQHKVCIRDCWITRKHDLVCEREWYAGLYHIFSL